MKFQAAATAAATITLILTQIWLVSPSWGIVNFIKNKNAPTSIIEPTIVSIRKTANCLARPSLFFSSKAQYLLPKNLIVDTETKKEIALVAPKNQLESVFNKSVRKRKILRSIKTTNNPINKCFASCQTKKNFFEAKSASQRNNIAKIGIKNKKAICKNLLKKDWPPKESLIRSADASPQMRANITSNNFILFKIPRISMLEKVYFCLFCVRIY